MLSLVKIWEEGKYNGTENYILTWSVLKASMWMDYIDHMVQCYKVPTNIKTTTAIRPPAPDHTPTQTLTQCTQQSSSYLRTSYKFSKNRQAWSYCISGLFLPHSASYCCLALFIGAHAVQWQPRRDICTVWPHSWTGGELMPFDGVRGSVLFQPHCHQRINQQASSS